MRAFGRAHSQQGAHMAHRLKAPPQLLQAVQLLTTILKPVFEGEPAAGHKHEKVREVWPTG